MSNLVQKCRLDRRSATSGLPETRRFSECFGMSQRRQQAAFHFGRLAPQRREVIFCNLSFAASRRNIILRFLTLAVAAPAHHHWCEFFMAARW